MPTIDSARTWYPAFDAVHGFDHVLRVYRMAERIAQLEGADLAIVQAAALLHDTRPDARGAGGNPRAAGDGRLDHQMAAAGFASQVLAAEGWDAQSISAVLHCIRAHRFRNGSEPPSTAEARILYDADKLDAIGAIGVARAVAYAAAHGQVIFEKPSTYFLASGQTKPGESHSAYHEYLFKLRHIKERLFTLTARQVAEQRHLFMAEFFDRLAAEQGSER